MVRCFDAFAAAGSQIDPGASHLFRECLCGKTGEALTHFDGVRIRKVALVRAYL
jgi:hypothetical protein